MKTRKDNLTVDVRYRLHSIKILANDMLEYSDDALEQDDVRDLVRAAEDVLDAAAEMLTRAQTHPCWYP